MNCQKCRAPLKLDGSLEDLNPAAFDLLIGATGLQSSKPIQPLRPAYPQERKALYDRVSRNATTPSLRRNGSSARQGANALSAFEAARTGMKDNQAMSFVMLTESQVVQPSTPAATSTAAHKQKSDGSSGATWTDGEVNAMSHELERRTRLYEILSARSDIDHPICVECTELLVEGLQKRLEAANRERDAHVGFLKQVTADTLSDEEMAQNKRQLQEARQEEAAATQELLKLEKEKADLDEEIAQLEDKARALDLEEEKFWRSRNAFATKLSEFQDERDSMNLKYEHDSQQLEKLQRTNVYNDTFCISHDGKFGTINGLRLGRLHNIPVDWPEINAAWGHALLLLATVAERLNFKFDGYELQPMGSTSRIIKIDGQSPSSSRTGQPRRFQEPTSKILELHSSGDMILGLTFMHRKLDRAMVAFLDCMRQLGDFVYKESAKVSENGVGLSLPYKINGEMIDEVSIKLGLAQDDSWSRACKYTLTCCKFLLAHASNVNANKTR